MTETVDEANPPLVVQIRFRDLTKLDHLVATLDVWAVDYDAGSTTQGRATVLVDGSTFRRLRREAALSVTVDVERTQEFRTQLARAQGEVAAASSVPSETIPGFECYRTVETTNAELARLAVDYPNLAQWRDIGDSWDKVNGEEGDGDDLHALVLTNRDVPGPKPRLVILAAIHARELTTTELAARFAEQLVAGYGVEADATWLLDYNELHLIPYGNPDGREFAEQGFYWRKNVNNTNGCSTFPQAPQYTPFYYGTDLNRNSSFRWNSSNGSGSSGDACDETYRGPSAASEPETQAIQGYLADVFPDQRGEGDGDAAPADTTGVFLSLHSYSELVLFPWGYSDQPAPNNAGLETLGRKFGHFTRYRICQAGEPGCIYRTDGTTDDWAYGELGVPAYTFELGTSFFQSCSTFEDILAANLPALTYALKVAHRPYQLPSGPDALDVVVEPAAVAQGQPAALRATVDDTRYFSNGFGSEPTQPIAEARYTLNAPAWISGTSALAMTPTDGAFDAGAEAVIATVDTSELVPGRYSLLVQGRDVDGNWGAPNAAWLTVVEPGSEPQPTPTATPPAPTAAPSSTPLPTPLSTPSPAPSQTPMSTAVPQPTAPSVEPVQQLYFPLVIGDE